MGKNNLFVSIENFIDENIKNIENNIANINNKLLVKLSLREKISLKKELKNFNEQLLQYNRLKRLLFSLKNNNKQDNFISPDLKKHFALVGTKLEKDVSLEFHNLINTLIKNSNKNKIDKVNIQEQEIKRLLNNLIKGKSKEVNLEKIFNDIDKIIMIKKQNIFYDETMKKFEENNLEDYDNELFNKIERIAKNHKLEEIKEINLVVKNLGQLKNIYYMNLRAKDTNIAVANLLERLNRISDVDYSRIKFFLQNIYNQNERLIKESTKYINKFSLDEVEKIIDKHEQRIEKSNLNDNITKYAYLSYYLLNLLDQQDRDYEKIRETQCQMIEIGSKLSKSDLEEAMNQGALLYRKKSYQSAEELLYGRKK